MKVGHLYFNVRPVDKEMGEAGGFYGCTNTADQEIMIQEGMKPHNLADTFIHEVMHAMCWVAEIGFRHQGPVPSDEEDFVTHLAHAMCRFWQDNPEAARWWARVATSEPA